MPYRERRYREPVEAPAVVLWCKVYIGAMVAACVLGVVLGVIFMAQGGEHLIGGILVAVFAFFCTIFYGLPLIGGRQPWVWTYSLVLICFGLPSCTILASLPLLIFWLKPETKRYYGKRG